MQGTLKESASKETPWSLSLHLIGEEEEAAAEKSEEASQDSI